MKKKKKRGLGWALSEMLSGRGTLSAKRICGTWLILLVSICTIWHVCVNGITDIAETLLETELIVATALLGITSITGIFSRSKIAVGKTIDPEPEIQTDETDTDAEESDTAITCPHGFECPYQ